ncbi:MAG: hypothetical protein LBB41_07345 [Prevotellaceae bacterium]|jgi:radical SAM superfamily enzyme YgiQ (UPF0313 family)|nr:hypothetical protein [Prevotellaceae bacterium]
MKTKINKIGIIALDSRKHKSEQSIGALVVFDILERNGWHISWCSYANAQEFDLVLISMTSTDDIYQIYANCEKHNFRNRKNIVMLGGFGCLNPLPLAPFADFAFFGRADEILPAVIENINYADDYDFIMRLSAPKICEIRQVEKCYSFPVVYDGCKWQETSIGCPVRCKFCHFSHARKWVAGEQKTFEWLIKNRTIECLIKDIPQKITEKQGWIKSAIDGYSERLRFAYGKKFATWQNIESAFDHVMSFKGISKLHLYNIHNLPTETASDRQEFFDFFKRYAESSMKYNGKLIVEIHNTPFRPTINTPLERESVSLYPQAKPINYAFLKHRTNLEYKKDSLVIAEGTGFIAKWTKFIEMPFKHLKDVIAIRCYGNFDIIKEISLGNYDKMSSQDAIDLLDKKFDILSFIKKYDETEVLPFKWVK